jgi:bacterioferritin-associated ferredoxin
MNREGCHSYQSERLVIATGTHERVLPFPGWTLPGVIGLGAATLMLKSQQVLPGHRTVVAGCGPLLPLVAASILKAGGKLAAYVDLNGASDFARALPDLAIRPRRLWQAVAWMSVIRRSGTPMLFRHAVVEVQGADAVEQIRIARLGANGREPVVVAADSLAIAYGLVPSTEATRLLGAAHYYDRDLGAWRPTTQGIVRTSLQGLYVAGDVAGVAGAPAAALRGRLAGLAAAIDSGCLLPGAAEDRDGRWRRDLQGEERFARGLSAMMRVPSDLYAAITPETIVCRCEDVTRREIEAAIACGAREEGEIKAWTRCGMGPCQGRMCRDSVSALLSASSGGASAGGSWTARPPLRPVPLDLLTGDFEYGDIRMPGPAPS